MRFSPKIPYVDSDGEYDEDDEQYEDDKQDARDKQVAEDYEPKLCKEISRWGTLGAISSRKEVAGWVCETMESSLEQAQMYKAIMTLPRDHPAYMAMIRNFMASLGH
jgi:hypothetical protein